MEYSSSVSSTRESISVMYSTKSVITGTYCDAPKPFQNRLYGSFDNDISLGRYLKNVLFDQTQFCPSCKEPTEAHLTSYFHEQLKLTFNVRRVPSLKLEGKEDGNIWTWHRCLICEQIDGIPPAATQRRTVMSDADLGLSLMEFLMFGFTNYATGNQLARCGHSLQRDCLQYYGFGDMVIFLQYSSIEMFSVCLPSTTLEFKASATSLLSDAAAVYDNEPPTWAISHALNSKEYKDQIGDKHIPQMFNVPSDTSESDEAVSDHETNDDEPEESYSCTTDHITISFEDDGSPNETGKVKKTKKKFSVTCYFAGPFYGLRKRFSVGELDFISSLSCCSTMGEKTNKNTYFAKSFDERFVIKQVTKTELESFVEFAPDYFRHEIESRITRIPTCITKIMGMYQVITTDLNDEENKKITMELMVMENIFFKRKISRIYSFKDSVRCHDISKKTDPNEVLLDMNVSEEVPAVSFFLPREGKGNLKRAVLCTTGFLHRIELTDYFLLVGVDEECQELVFGIFDFFTKYTSDLHIKAWNFLTKYYSASAQKNDDSPTIASPEELEISVRKLVAIYLREVL